MNDTVRDSLGREGRLLERDAGDKAAIVELPDGSRTPVPADWLQPADDGYVLPLAFEALRGAEVTAAGEITLPVCEETLDVHRRTDEEVVRVRKAVHTREARLRQELVHEDVELERVRVDREVTEAPAVREEGDVLVVPLLEEQIVWRKRLVLREEVRIRKRRQARTAEVRAPLRREEVRVEREEKEP